MVAQYFLTMILIFPARELINLPENKQNDPQFGSRFDQSKSHHQKIIDDRMGQQTMTEKFVAICILLLKFTLYKVLLTLTLVFVKGLI